MHNKNNETAEKIIKNFVAISKGAFLYSDTHPAVITPLNAVSAMLRELHKDKDIVNFGVVNGLLFVEDFVFYEENVVISQFIAQMTDKKIETVSILRGFDNKELLEVLKLIATQDPLLQQSDAINNRLASKGIVGIKIKCADDDIEKKAKKAYAQAVDVVMTTFEKVRTGQIPKIEKAQEVVKDIVGIIFTDHNAMVCLTMIKAYDNYTFNHSVNVSVLSVAIAKALKLEERIINEIGIAGLLHDIGKTHTSKYIITKPGRLTEEEFNIIMQHPVKGAEILKQMNESNKNVLEMVSQHHVHYDKRGYPALGQSQLNPYATIITVADTYDAITTIRPYQPPVTPKEALNIMLCLEDSYFEKKVIRKFVEVLGIYPTGSFVRLDTNEIAFVTKQNQEDAMAPIIKIVIDSNGNKVKNVVETDLRENDTANNRRLRAIVCSVEPTFIGLNIADYINA